MARGRGRRGQRDYSRMDRVSELCRHIVADELERIDDDRLELVTVTHVEVEPDLRHGTVFFSTLGDDDEQVKVGLEQHRPRLQSAIARQARLKRTPELAFRRDEVIERGQRVEEILRRTRSDGEPE